MMEIPTTQITSHEIDKYRQTAMRRQIETQTQVAQLCGKAWE
jgi:hypothetical protein